MIQVKKGPLSNLETRQMAAFCFFFLRFIPATSQS